MWKQIFKKQYKALDHKRNRRRRGRLMARALDSGSKGRSPDRGDYVLFLDKALCSHSASLHPGV